MIMSEATDASGEKNRYDDVEGIYVDENGNPRAETEELSKSGESGDEN
jgi:hypothetical protein